MKQKDACRYENPVAGGYDKSEEKRSAPNITVQFFVRADIN